MSRQEAGRSVRCKGETLVDCKIQFANSIWIREKRSLALHPRGVKCVLPESVFTEPRGTVDARSWDAAIDVVQQSLLAMAAGDDVTDEEDYILTAVFMGCEELRAKEYLEVVPTNRELSKKYGVSRRTVTNWRKAGCPFEDGQWAVLDWIAQRRYAPAGANAKFRKQLSERRDKAVLAKITAPLHEAVAQARQLKASYQSQGLKPPEWLRGFRASRSKVRCNNCHKNRPNL